MSDLQIEEATLEEAVAELSTLHDWLRWTTSQFASSSIFFGHGTDTVSYTHLTLPTNREV